MTALQVAVVGEAAVRDGWNRSVRLTCRDGGVFEGPLTYVCDEYALLGGRGFPLEDISAAELV